jgi:hypothetical protein
VWLSGYQCLQTPGRSGIGDSTADHQHGSAQIKLMKLHGFPEVRRFARDLSTFGPAVLPFSAIQTTAFAEAQPLSDNNQNPSIHRSLLLIFLT